MLGEAVWPLAWAGLLTVLLTGHARSLFARGFDLGWLRNLGRYSYAMYVFQSPLIPLMAPVLAWRGARSFAGGGVPAHLLSMGLMFALTYALAWLSWHAYEKHWLAMKRWFPAHDAPAADHRVQGDQALANHYRPGLAVVLPALRAEAGTECSAG
jgi:peptidoglycan/LPS O-acetylase OafA/YrhL